MHLDGGVVESAKKVVTRARDDERGVCDLVVTEVVRVRLG